MSDTNYMNTYVNLVVETVHGYLNDILQLKTQLSVINGLVSEKDQAIVSLEQKLKSLREEKEKHEGDESEMQKLRDNAASWEFQYNNMANKVSHMDALTNQFNDLKTEFKSKNVECDKLREENEQFKEQVKTLTKQIKEYEKKYKIEKPIVEEVINKKETKSSAVVEKVKALEPSKVIMKVEVKNENDDF